MPIFSINMSRQFYIFILEMLLASKSIIFILGIINERKTMNTTPISNVFWINMFSYTVIWREMKLITNFKLFVFKSRIDNKLSWVQVVSSNLVFIIKNNGLFQFDRKRIWFDHACMNSPLLYSYTHNVKIIK